MKILPVAAIALAIFCTPASALDAAETTTNNLRRCINAHEALSELYDHIGKQDIDVSALYSQYEVAVRNTISWGDEWPKAKRLADKAGANATARHYFKEVDRKWKYWQDVKEEKLSKIGGLMFSREFKINKLVSLRRLISNCRSFPLPRDTIKDVCSEIDYRKSNWCRERF